MFEDSGGPDEAAVLEVATRALGEVLEERLEQRLAHRAGAAEPAPQGVRRGLGAVRRRLRRA